MTTKEQVIENSPFKPELKKITYYRRESTDSFTIRLDWQLDHGAGQFIFCSLPGIGEVPISICSHNDKYIELNIREVGNVTRAMSSLKEGDELLCRGPYGTEYPMDEMKGKDMIIVGGGCGVAPLKGAIEYIEDNRDDYKEVSMFFGFRTLGDTLFSSHIDNWKKTFDLNISFDHLDDSASCSLGTQGFVTQLVQDKVQDNKNKMVLLCGPPIMIEKVTEILVKKGFKDEQIYLSAERLMYCGIGKCGRCMIHGKYTCLDGSVFRFDELKDSQE